VAVVGIVVACLRFHAAAYGSTIGDFLIFFRAGRTIADGASPYLAVGYVYPPLLALVLAPFGHLPVAVAGAAWTFLSCLGLVAAPALVAASRPLAPWGRVLLFAVGVATVLDFWPTTTMLWLGQADWLVLVVLAGALWADGRSWSRTSGVLIGVAGLLKAWPAMVIVTVAARGKAGQWRTLKAFALTILLAPFLAVVLAGGGGVPQMFDAISGARVQHLVSDSVWGVPALNFSRTGLATPLVVSPLLQAVTTVLLLLWVGAVLWFTLRWASEDFGIAFWNVVVCVVLVLPISHLAYVLYDLPVLWCWTARWLERVPDLPGMPLGRAGDGSGAGALRRSDTVVLAGIVSWWIVMNKAWPNDGSPASAGSLGYSVVFLANALMVTVSTIGLRRPKHPGESQVVERHHELANRFG